MRQLTREELAQQLQDIFYQVNELTKNKIVNAAHAQELSENFLNSAKFARYKQGCFAIGYNAAQSNAHIRETYWPIYLAMALYLYEDLTPVNFLMGTLLINIAIAYAEVKMAPLIYLLTGKHRLEIPMVNDIGKKFLLPSERKQANLSSKLSLVHKDIINDIQKTENTWERGLFGLKHGVFECVGISGLVSIKLLEVDIPFIRLQKEEGFIGGLSHSYIVAGYNLPSYLDSPTGSFFKAFDIQPMDKWPDDCYIIDPWYGVFTSIAEIKAEPGGINGFLQRYPLLNPVDKSIVDKYKQNTSDIARKYHEFKGSLPENIENVFEDFIAESNFTRLTIL